MREKNKMETKSLENKKTLKEKVEQGIVETGRGIRARKSLGISMGSFLLKIAGFSVAQNLGYDASTAVETYFIASELADSIGGVMYNGVLCCKQAILNNINNSIENGMSEAEAVKIWFSSDKKYQKALSLKMNRGYRPIEFIIGYELPKVVCGALKKRFLK